MKNMRSGLSTVKPIGDAHHKIFFYFRNTPTLKTFRRKLLFFIIAPLKASCYRARSGTLHQNRALQQTVYYDSTGYRLQQGQRLLLRKQMFNWTKEVARLGSCHKNPSNIGAWTNFWNNKRNMKAWFSKRNGSRKDGSSQEGPISGSWL